MKLIKKRIYTFAIAIIIAFSAFFSSGIIFNNLVFASSRDTDYAYKYFYSQIEKNKMAKRFYDAFETLFLNGSFKEGKVQFDLISNNVVSQDDVSAYINGVDNNKLTQAYATGRDAFYMDHPDLFYVDVFSTSISAGTKDGKNVAYLDSSRVLSMYNGSINSKGAVDEAIKNYNNEISKIVTEAEKKSSIVEKINYVNSYIAKNNTYGFGTEVNGDKNVDTHKAGYIHTSYGALINKESVCEGYAKGFKAIMDRLNIPCVCIQGYADGGKDGQYEPHMWNYVEIDDMWYLVDVTYNATSSTSSTENYNWLLVGEESVYETHIEDNVISSSGVKLNYPALKPYSYGSDNTDKNGMTIVGSYITDDYGKYLELVVSYNGKSATRLASEGKYLAFRTGNNKDESSEEITWSRWHSIVACNDATKVGVDDDLFPNTDFDTTIRPILTAYNKYFQFTVIDIAPDELGQIYLTEQSIVSYKDSSLTESNHIEPSTPYQNNAYNQNRPSPGATGFYPANTGTLPVDQTYDIKVVYTDDLVLDEGFNENTIWLNIESSHGNDTIKENSKIENFKWDGARTITFKFTPSRMYIHNSANCYFTPVGLIGKKSGKKADPFTYSFKGKSVVCSKIFNDGRLYMNVFGAPSLLDNSDLSVTDFKDKNGKYFAESQRSQLLLVASKPSNEKVQEMEGRLKQDMNIKENELVSSSTYEINLQICGVVQKVPNGSYMQVAFGFPEGFDKNDAGTTFKIYHYKHDNAGNITGVEEIPVIVTEYGLIAKVTSFSPFTVVQIKNSSSAVQNSNSKNIYAFVNGNLGGTVTTEGKGGIAEVKNNAITYDINADNGYTIGCVRLNGKVIDSSKYDNGKLTLNKDSIEANNMLEVVFVSKESADRYASSGINISYGDKFQFPSNDNSKGGLIAFLVILALAVVCAGGVAVWWFFIKNKPATANATSNKSKSTAKNNAVKQNKNKVVTKKTTTLEDSKTKPVSNTKNKTNVSSKTANKPVTSSKTALTKNSNKPSSKTVSKPVNKSTTKKKK